jgi:CRP/FNR family cyclic AMP-dependent transcriptional regulator
VLSIPSGTWEAQTEADTARGGVLIVLRGALLRCVGVHGGFGAELLGPGDIIRPKEHDGEDTGILPVQTDWRVLAATKLAVLDILWGA